MNDDVYVPELHSQFARGADAVAASSNERAVLELVRRHPDISRAELTRFSRLTAPSVNRLIDGLVQRGLLRLGSRVVKGRGHPSVVVELVPEFAYSFGVSVTTDAFSIALIDFAANVREQQVVARHPLEFEFFATTAQQLMVQMLKRRRIPKSRLFGIGLGMTGPFIGKGSRMNPPETLPEEWALVELDRLLAERWSQPLWLDNAANCAATGESLLGVGRWADDFAYLHFTQGFGGGVVLGGQCHRGAHGNAGEFGAMLPNVGLGEDRPTLESLRVLLAEAGHRFDDVHTMLAHYDPAWPQLEAWIDRVHRSLSFVLSAIQAVLDLDAIVLGTELPRDLAERLIARVGIKHPLRRGLRLPQPKLVLAEAPSDPVAIGAATLPFKDHFFAPARSASKRSENGRPEAW